MIAAMQPTPYVGRALALLHGTALQNPKGANGDVVHTGNFQQLCSVRFAESGEPGDGLLGIDILVRSQQQKGELMELLILCANRGGKTHF